MSQSGRIIDGVRTQIVTVLVAIGAFTAVGEWQKRCADKPEGPPAVDRRGGERAGGEWDPRTRTTDHRVGRESVDPNAPGRLPEVLVAQYLPPTPQAVGTGPSAFPFIQPVEGGPARGGVGDAASGSVGAAPLSPSAAGGAAPSGPAPATMPPAPVGALPGTPAPGVGSPPAPATIAPPGAPPLIDPLPLQETLPVGDPQAADRVHVRVANELVSITAQDAPLATVVGLIARHHGLNIVTPQNMPQTITVTLNDVPLDDALSAILTVNSYTWAVKNNILFVTAVDSKLRGAPAVQGRVLKVFPLNYVSALDVDKIVKGLLSPVGQSFTVETNPTDKRKTQEKIVVEDLPSYMERIEQYIQGIDYQPRQVVVEARVLQVKLNDDMKHGVNFERLVDVAHSHIKFNTAGFASATASPAGLITIDGPDVSSVVEALQATTDTKTLAAPKVAVLNGQKARIQIGGRIGYLTSTSTMTTTVQTVNFLDTGVILEVTPLITADGQILLTVKPQVSAGRINPTTNLPESDNTDVETQVMLANGEAVVIGGLISEKDIENENKLPWLGNVKYIGWLFRRKTHERERSEVIITLQPRIVCDTPGCRQPDPRPIEQTMAPIFSDALVPVDRTRWEPPMPSASKPYRAPLPPVVTFEPVNEPGMAAGEFGPGPAGMPPTGPMQVYPPMPPLPSEEPIPPPPAVESLPAQGAAYLPPWRAENASFAAVTKEQTQAVAVQYADRQYAPMQSGSNLSASGPYGANPYATAPYAPAPYAPAPYGPAPSSSMIALPPVR